MKFSILNCLLFGSMIAASASVFAQDAVYQSNDVIDSFSGKYTVDASASDSECLEGNRPIVYEIKPLDGNRPGIELDTPHGVFAFVSDYHSSSTGEDAGPYKMTTTYSFDGRTFKYKYAHSELVLATIIPIPLRRSTTRSVTRNDDGSITLSGNFSSDLDEDGSKKFSCLLLRST